MPANTAGTPTILLRSGIGWGRVVIAIMIVVACAKKNANVANRLYSLSQQSNRTSTVSSASLLSPTAVATKKRNSVAKK